MVAVFLLLCISLKLFLQTQGQNIQKAKIYSKTREIPEGDDLEVTCSTFGYTTKSVYLYLCQNGKAIEMKKQRNQEDTVFRLQHIEKNKTGNYSCVFSEDGLKTNEVMGYGDNHIFINVTEPKTLIPAEIRLLKSEVQEGSDAEFTCKPSKFLNRTSTRQLILAILIKKGTNISIVNILDPKKAMATFTLRKVRKDDAGTYSCVVMLNTLFYPEKWVYGNNEVNLNITAAPVVYSSTGEVKIFIVSLILLLFIILLLGILAMIQKQGRLRCLNKRCLENEEEPREVVRVLHEETVEAEAAGEIQSTCQFSEWDDFSDTEEDDLHIYQEHLDVEVHYAVSTKRQQSIVKSVCDV
ncbi:uncharacterized protein [Misgurnus anguillicaudatus]|uniref:uncharacterized protein isoform X1 n=1 Tax=Misgurnus anguillicaudatus TaxID=75329 RepID=UPI003CCF4190